MDVDVPTYFASNSFFKRIKIKTTRDLTSQSIGYYIQYIIKVFISKELVKKGIKIELGGELSAIRWLLCARLFEMLI